MMKQLLTLVSILAFSGSALAAWDGDRDDDLTNGNIMASEYTVSGHTASGSGSRDDSDNLGNVLVSKFDASSGGSSAYQPSVGDSRQDFGGIIYDD